jgi:hypothetical protein
VSTEQAGYAAAEHVAIRRLTVREQYGEGAHKLLNPTAIGSRSLYANATYSQYPPRPARREIAFGREDIYPEPVPEFQVDVPREFGDLHHRAPNYQRTRISEAVFEGTPIEPRRRAGRLAFAIWGVLTLSLLGGAASCSLAVKQGLGDVMAMQSDYQQVATHVPEAPGLASNPLIAPYQAPTDAANLPLQVDPPKPTPTAPKQTVQASPANARQTSCIDKWILERRVGQLVILPLDQNGVYALASKQANTDVQTAKATTKRVMRELHIGGILLTDGTPAQKAAIIKEYSAKGAFEAPLLIGDVATDEWYGFNKPTLTTSADMGAPSLPGDPQLTIADRFVFELQAKTNAPVFLSDTINKKHPLNVYDQVFAMRSAAVSAVLDGAFDANLLNQEVVQNFMARGDKGADPCAVNLNR